MCPERYGDAIDCKQGSPGHCHPPAQVLSPPLKTALYFQLCGAEGCDVVLLDSGYVEG